MTGQQEALGVGATFNWLDISLQLSSCQIFCLEPICDHQFSIWTQQYGCVLEEELLIWQVAHRLRYPHAIEATLRSEILAHLLGIKLNEACRSTPNVYGLPCGFISTINPSCLLGKPDGHFDLLPADCYTSDMAIVVLCQVTRRSAHSTAHVKDYTALWQLSAVEKKLDQADLGTFFGIGGFHEIAVVQMLAPDFISEIVQTAFDASIYQRL